MPTTSDSAGAAVRPMPAWIKAAMLAGFIFFVCWGGAILYWRTSRSAPGGGEMALYLLGLPSLLVLGLLVGRTLAARRALPAAAPAAAAAGADAAAPPPATATASVAILATALRTAHGVFAGELAAAIAGDKARADLDPELVDDDGFPIMSVRSPDAKDEALQEEISAWLQRNGMAELQVGDEQWRALVLGTAVLEDLVGQAIALLIPDDDAPAPLLRLAPLLPADWPAAHRSAAAMWFEHEAARSGWPGERIVLIKEAADDAQALSPSALLARLARDAAAMDTRMTVLAVACGSGIGDDTVARWSANGSLFASAQPQGLIPGEGAAGLLLSDVAQARVIEGARVALLEPLQETRRDVSVDEARRTDSAALGAAVHAALAHHGGADVVKIVADTGHRSSRVLELMGFMAATLPQLDETTDLLRAGEACGSCGAVPFTAALALAVHEAIAAEGAVLCIGNEDPFRRCALVVQAG